MGVEQQGWQVAPVQVGGEKKVQRVQCVIVHLA